MKNVDIINAWIEIRKQNHNIPDEVLDLMKDSALKELNKVETPVDKLVVKYLDILNTMKDNRAKIVDMATDEENRSMDSIINAVAEFIRDLKTIVVKPVENLIPQGHYNETPEGLVEISIEEWQRGMFHYNIERSSSKQVCRNGDRFDLRLFDVPNFDNKKLGYAVMEDWYDPTTGKLRPERIVRFCKYGKEEDWKSFEGRFAAQFAAQFAGDNS